MPLADEQLNQARGLLKLCSAQLRSGAGEQSRGSGFFVGDELILTCAHVLEAQEGEEVVVQPFDRDSRPGTVIRHLDGKDLDLALVQAARLEDEEPLPSVLLDEAIVDNVDYFAVGFPDEHLLGNEGLEEVVFTARARLRSAVEVDLLRIDHSKGTIGDGLSGAAVLNSETGAVVALVQYSEAPSGTEGGAAIPIARAVNHLTEVDALVTSPPASSRRWRKAIGEHACRALGKPTHQENRVDLFLEGDPSSWSVRVGSDGEPVELTGENLSSEISMALFNWAQRRQMRTKPDVEFLGRLLAEALFPREVATALRRESDGGDLLIRLHVDPDAELFEVPWELATLDVEGKPAHAGQHQRLGLTRVMAEQQPMAAAPKESARMLGAVVQPPNAQPQMSSTGLEAGQVPWPAKGEIQGRLEKAMNSGHGFSAQVLSNPTPVALMQALENAPASTVFHYIGFGQVSGGEPCLMLADDDQIALPRPFDDICEWVGETGSRLFVVEVMLPPFGTESEPIPPNVFRRAIRGSVEAVLFTRFPLHPRALSTFNNVFYERLASGDTIERAVQASRSSLYMNNFSGNTSDFGCFALLSGERAVTSLVFPAQEPAQAPSRALPDWAPRQAEPTPVGEESPSVAFEQGAGR